MKIGIMLAMLHPARWAEAAQEAERLGYESVWLPDHLVLPVQASGSPQADEGHPPIGPDVQVFDVFSYLAYLAARTERIRLGTYVYNIGLRHPFVSARCVATTDILSQGRIEFGVGASWLAEEWQAAQLDFRTRGSRVDEALRVVKRLWTERVVAHEGDSFRFPEVMFEPKPRQEPHPPVHIGGDSRAAWRRCARYGDGWMPLSTPHESLPAARAEIAAMRVAAGRAPKFELTAVAGDPGHLDLARCADLGIDRILVRPWARTSLAIEGLRQFAARYLPMPAGQPGHEVPQAVPLII
jgi:probable F420-dependent oxidoreductase